jgi:hypothetical protein
MEKKVLVNVWAKQYETSRPIAEAEILDMETGESWHTGDDGYAQLFVEPGRSLSLTFNKQNFPSVQTGTVIVPPEGLTGENKEITLQVPGKYLYNTLRAVFGKPAPGKHHVVTTVSAAGKNLHDDKGEGGAIVSLRSVDGSVRHDNPVYLGSVFGKTEWLRPIATSRISFLNRFAQKLTGTDGGAIFKNVEPGEYIIEAKKDDRAENQVSFTSAKIKIFPTTPELVNVSPPQGPRVKQ